MIKNSKKREIHLIHKVFELFMETKRIQEQVQKKQTTSRGRGAEMTQRRLKTSSYLFTSEERRIRTQRIESNQREAEQGNGMEGKRRRGNKIEQKETSFDKDKQARGNMNTPSCKSP